MPFNPSGIYQRLYDWATDRDNSVKIMATRMDDETNGIVDAINEVTAGNRPFRSSISLANGTAASPGARFDSDTDTGLYRVSADKIGLAAGGQVPFMAVPNQVLVKDGTVSEPGLGFINDSDTGLYRDADGDIAMTLNGVAAGKLDRERDLGTLLTSSDNLNTITTPGKYYWLAGSLPSNRPASAGSLSGSMIVEYSSSATIILQTVTVRKDTGGSAFVAIISNRLVMSGTPQVWVDGDEYGSNANGEYIRRADGTMTCFVRSGTVTASTAIGSLYTSGATSMPLPATFISATGLVVSGSVARVAGSIGHWLGSASSSTLTASAYMMVVVTGSTGIISLRIDGRWY